MGLNLALLWALTLGSSTVQCLQERFFLWTLDFLCYRLSTVLPIQFPDFLGLILTWIGDQNATHPGLETHLTDCLVWDKVTVKDQKKSGSIRHFHFKPTSEIHARFLDFWVVKLLHLPAILQTWSLQMKLFSFSMSSYSGLVIKMPVIQVA